MALYSDPWKTEEAHSYKLCNFYTCLQKLYCFTAGKNLLYSNVFVGSRVQLFTEKTTHKCQFHFPLSYYEL